MFAQWWGDVLVQSAIFVQRLVTWDNEAFQTPTTAQTQTLSRPEIGLHELTCKHYEKI